MRADVRLVPTVSFTAPADAATVRGDVLVSVDASSDVVRVVFADAEGTFAVDDTPPFAALWHTRRVKNGPTSLFATPYDATLQYRGGQRGRTVFAVNDRSVRYAAPHGTGLDPCPVQSPCSFGHAVGHAISGDEVVLLPGVYDLSSDGGDVVEVERDIEIHGADGKPRPRLMGSLVMQAGSLRHVRVEVSAPRPALSVSHSYPGESISDVVVVAAADGIDVRRPDWPGAQGSLTIRDTVVHVQGPRARAISVYDGEVQLRNVTAWASGRRSEALFANVSASITAKNVIARGTAYDLVTASSSQGVFGTINVDHSNYRPTRVWTTPHGLVNDHGANQRVGPLFVDPANGNFRQLPGSPTIDAGIADGSTGPFDPDGDSRATGGRPDIGADEWVPGRIPGACVVPFLHGRTLSRARAALTSANCRLGLVSRAYSRSTARGRILAQRPKTGAQLAARSAVRVAVSRGPRPHR